MTDAMIEAAVARALSVTSGWSGKCDWFSAWCWTGGASGYDTAYENWLAIPDRYKHPGDTKPPKGAIGYWRYGSKGYGHAAPIVTDDYEIHSTNMSPQGRYSATQVSTVPLLSPAKWYAPGTTYALEYLGWASPYFEGRLIHEITKETPVSIPTMFDASGQRPTPATVKAYGATGVIEYVSDYPSKNVTKAECAAYVAAGLGIAFVWEDTTTDAFAGYDAGYAAGKKAVAQLEALGCPAGVVVFAACDSNSATPAQVAPYFQGWAKAVREGGYLDGIYGNGAICAAGLCTYRWKVETWGSETGVAHLIQQVNNPAPHPNDTDANQVLHGIPTWVAHPVAAPAPIRAQTAIHVHNALRELAMVSTDTPARMGLIHNAQNTLKEIA